MGAQPVRIVTAPPPELPPTFWKRTQTLYTLEGDEGLPMVGNLYYNRTLMGGR